MHHTMCNAAYFNYTIIVMQKEMEGREETFQRMRQTGEVGREKREREREGEGNSLRVCGWSFSY